MSESQILPEKHVCVCVCVCVHTYIKSFCFQIVKNSLGYIIQKSKFVNKWKPL